jgi:hypothetical protein
MRCGLISRFRFLLALPGVSASRIDPVEQDGTELTGQQFEIPAGFASHSRLQEFYFGPDLLLARHDYRVDVAGGFPAIPYVSDFVEADGIPVPTKRRLSVRQRRPGQPR